MPTYTIRDPRSGKTVKLTGDAPPTEAELQTIFAQVNAPEATRQRGWSGRVVPALASATGTPEAAWSGTRQAVDAIEGMASVVPQVVFGAGDLVRRGLGMDRVVTRPEVRQAMTAPLTAAGKAGQLAGQTAAFLALPTGAGLSVPAQMAVQGTGSAAMTAAQGGTGRDALVSGALSAAGPVISQVIGPAARRLKDSAISNISQAFDATTLRNKRTVEQVAPEMLRRGTWAATREGLAEQADDALRALGSQYDEAEAALVRAGKPMTTNRMATADVRQPIQQAMQELVVTGSSGKAVPINPQKYQALQELDATIADLGDKVSRETLQTLKEEWADRVAKAGGYAEKVGDAAVAAEVWAKRKAADAARRVLASDSPDIAKLNAEFTFWSRVQDVAEATIARKRPQKGALRRVAGMVGAAAGFAKGGTVGAAAGAAAMSQAVRLMDSPGWKLLSARAKSQLADAMTSGNADRIGAAVSRLVASLPARYRNSITPSEDE